MNKEKTSRVRNFKSLLVLFFFLLCSNFSFAEDANLKIRKYSLHGLQGTGFAGVGSGLAFLRKEGNDLYFLSVSDSPYNQRQNNLPVSFLSTIRVSPSIAEVVKLQKITTTRHLDLEGVARGSNGLLWIADEHIPSFFELNPRTGSILRWLEPGKGIPEIFQHIKKNRGFEGIASSGSSIFVVVQSPLQKKKEKKSHRIIRYDTECGTVESYRYHSTGDSAKTRIGSLATLHKTKLLVLEQRTIKDDRVEAKVVEVKIPSREQCEFLESVTELAKPKVVFDLNQLGWNHDKTEGMAFLPGENTLAILNDNDAENDIPNEIWFLPLKNHS